MLGRSDWSPALVNALEHGQAKISELALDQKQSLSTHPDKKIAKHPRVLLPRGGGLPDPDRQKVLDRLAPLLKEGGDWLQRQGRLPGAMFQVPPLRQEGGGVGPDLTGIAAPSRRAVDAHPRPEPQRRGELRPIHRGHQRRPRDQRAARLRNQDLGRAGRRRGQAAGHPARRHRRDGRLQEVADARGVRKAGPTDDIRNCSRSSPSRASSCRSTWQGRHDTSMKGCSTTSMAPRSAWSSRLVAQFRRRRPVRANRPRAGKVPNVVLLYGPQGKLPPQMPDRSSSLQRRAGAIHFLSGVSGWGYPYGEKGSVSMIVRLHYADGSTEDHRWKTGSTSRIISAWSTFPARSSRSAPGQQIRYFAVSRRHDVIRAHRTGKGHRPVGTRRPGGDRRSRRRILITARQDQAWLSHSLARTAWGKRPLPTRPHAGSTNFQTPSAFNRRPSRPTNPELAHVGVETRLHICIFRSHRPRRAGIRSTCRRSSSRTTRRSESPPRPPPTSPDFSTRPRETPGTLRPSKLAVPAAVPATPSSRNPGSPLTGFIITTASGTATISRAASASSS